jgi:predicted nucleic acid-binding protein
MRVLLDTNIILDVLLEREPFVNDAAALFAAIELQRIEGFVTATTLTDIFYIVRKNRGVDIAKQAISRILTSMQICRVDRDILEQAFAMNINDFEDAVQLACAIAENLQGIVTRNTEDFAAANLPILTAGEVVELLAQNP